jgi:GNAT superfamily N-acetyltransferase
VNVKNVRIEEWDASHRRFTELLEFVQIQDKSNWFSFTADWHLSSHSLVALNQRELVGFLRFVVQPIGPDDDCPPVRSHAEILTEAKVLAFAVQPAYQGHGIGKKLQQRLVRRAKALGCYQIRSHSGGTHTENHQLKLSLGFGVHPVVRGEDRQGVYFILPLKWWNGSYFRS